jgi:hypothetical protein
MEIQVPSSHTILCEDGTCIYILRKNITVFEHGCGACVLTI